jgi:hypothetical protein
MSFEGVIDRRAHIWKTALPSLKFVTSSTSCAAAAQELHRRLSRLEHAHLRRLLLAAGLAFALFDTAYAADPQTFKTEDNATKFCKPGNVVWFNPKSKIYFEPGSRFYGKTEAGGFTCRVFADKAGFRANKGN